MKDRTLQLLTIASLFLAAGVVLAQDATPPAPPNVLVIQREYLKPGMAGSIHVRSEGNFVRAETDAKAPTHYIAMDSMSGPTRALFVFGFDSFEAYGKDQESLNGNPTLAAAIDQAALTDGQLLSRYDIQTFVYHPEMSQHTGIDASHQRYWEFTSYRIKPGHEKEWNDLVKIYVDGFASMPDRHWAAYESRYGEDNGGVWVVITPMRTLAELDQGMIAGKTFMTAQGADGMKHIEDLAADCILSSQSNLFAVNAKESYVDPTWATTAPEIYGQP